MRPPLLSIIIANYNYGDFLESALRSIISQTCSDYEIIVCDGGSSDNSVEVIKKYEDHIAWWCSETDHGQSEAFNKGFSHAKGRFITWLNADDILLPGTIKALKRLVGKFPDTQWITGNLVKFEHHNGRILEAPWGPHWVPSWIQGRGFPLPVFGPTTFWSREAYDELGPIDEDLHYVMDTDYWMRLAYAGYRYRRLNHTCWGFRLHETSKTAIFTTHDVPKETRLKINAERDKIYKKNDFRITWAGALLYNLLRIIDGSRFVDVYRRLFYIGRPLKDLYGV